MKKPVFYQLKPCIQSIFDAGMHASVKKMFGEGFGERLTKKLRNEAVRKKMYYLIHDFNRLGLDKEEIYGRLMRWTKTGKRLMPEHKAAEMIEHVLKWFYEESRFLGCRALSGDCVHQTTGCRFSPQCYRQPDYAPAAAEGYLQKKYAAYGCGYVAGKILLTIREAAQEKNFSTVFIGLRSIQQALKRKKRVSVALPRLHRLLYLLQGEGFFNIAAGEAGDIGKKRSNEYTLLNWGTPTGEALSKKATTKEPLVAHSQRRGNEDSVCVINVEKKEKKPACNHMPNSDLRKQAISAFLHKLNLNSSEKLLQFLSERITSRSNEAMVLKWYDEYTEQAVFGLALE